MHGGDCGAKGGLTEPSGQVKPCKALGTPMFAVLAMAAGVVGLGLGDGLGFVHFWLVAQAPAPAPFTADCESGALVMGLEAWGANSAIPGGAGGLTTSATAATTASRATVTTPLTTTTDL